MTELQIYVLELENNKWYIGKTTNAVERFQQHLNREGSAWTRKYKPLRVVEVNTGDVFDEDKVTKRYMSKYGIDNVRGGSYVTIELTDIQYQLLRNEINMALDNCALCGKADHFIKDCPVNNITECKRCGRKGHTTDKCYAKMNTDGKYITKTQTKERPTMLCSRCGRTNHFIEKCHAVSDIDNRVLLAIGTEYKCGVCEDLIYHNQPCDHGRTEMKNKLIKDMTKTSKIIMNRAKNISRGIPN